MTRSVRPAARRPSRRVARTVTAVLLITAASASLGTNVAGATAGPVVTTTPPRITTLSALNRWMNAAVTAKSTATYAQTTVVGAVETSRESGVVRWTDRRAAYSLTVAAGPYVGEHGAVVLPPRAYAWGEYTDDQGRPAWVMLRFGSPLGNNPYWTPQLQSLRQHLNPALLYPRLGTLPVTRNRTTVRLDGVTCWVHVVRMTTLQHFQAMPEGARTDPANQVGGITTVRFLVDARGLPHQVVATHSRPNNKYTEVTRLSGWGDPVTIEAPTGPIVDSATL